ncbi:DoxX family protein [Chitinophaga rhizosphaerae]|uniref:DoxX family protein n=1 Tax=Chitinophaga rhizosphaerae TaxID=1864947 RepID=UPI000F803D8A|nr:DoxX family protein [Chitinophaga rhizosphaerae]
MAKLLSTKYSNSGISLTLLLLRLLFGGLIMTHGWPKLVNFSTYAQKFADPFGIGKTASLGLTIFAEFFCGALVLVGLLTRFATVPLIICFVVIVFMIHGGDPVGKRELAIMFLTGFTALLIAGPGKYSLDGALGN